MDSNNWRPSAPQAEVPMETVDWRTQLQPDARQRIVDKIMEMLKKHLPFSSQAGLQELRKIAVRFEEKIYTAATSQPDYLRKISLKMLTMENKSQNTLPNSVSANTSSGGNRLADSGVSHTLPSQVQNQMPLHTQPQAHQQLIAQNVPNGMTPGGVQNSANLTATLPSVPNMTQTSLPNVGGLNSTIQNMPSISQPSAGNQMGQTVASNTFANSQRQIQGRQQVIPQQQASQSQNTQYLYQQQLQQKLLKPKFASGNPSHSLGSSHMQQPPQNMSQPNQLQSSQQSGGQPSTIMQASMMQTPSVSGIQQNQPSSVQQSTASLLQNQQQSVPRQQQAALIHQHQSQLIKQQLMGQQSNATSMQQNQLMGQNGISEMQQQQPRMLQQNSLQNMQHQQLMSQQSNMSNIHTQQMGLQNNVALQQQQLLGSQSGNSNMGANQHSVHMLQQSKVSSIQQQNTQQSQSQAPQQQLAPMQTQLQQQLAMQQQPNVQQQLVMQQPNAMPRDLQQRLQGQGQGQATNPLHQSQSIIDQQKQMYQPQRPLSDPSSTLDQTVQNGQVNVGDWQEETYQKIKQMKATYYNDLTEMYQKFSAKIKQSESMPQQANAEQVLKLKTYKQMVERTLHILQMSKGDVTSLLKEKLPSYEKQIIQLIQNIRPRKPMLPGLSQQHMQSLQQPQSQVSQLQSHDSHMNSQLQPINMQGSGGAMVMSQNSMSTLPHSSLTGVPTPQQSLNPLQPSSTMDSGQGSSLGSLQQVSVGSSQQNSVSTPQQSLASQSGVNMLSSNIPLQSSSSVRPHQQLKQHQEQPPMLQASQFKQQFQQRQVQQLMQKQQQIHHQTKQQLPGQLPAQQMSQLQHINDTSEMKVRPTMKPTNFQQHSVPGQRPSYPPQQLKPGTTSPQLPQHSSPQVDQQSMMSMTKTGTPLQSASSPFIVPSPSTPLAPSPLPGDSEKPIPGTSSLSNVGHQQVLVAPPSGPSLAIGTPGISASPLLAEFTPGDGAHGAALTTSGKLNYVEQPLERLLKAVKSLSPKVLSSAVSDIGSVVTMIDRIAGSAPGNGSRAAVGEDLVAMTKCRLQARNCASQDGLSGTKKMKRYTSAMPLNVVSSVGSFSDSFKQLTGSEPSDLESTATSKAKRLRVEENHALMEEIREINHQLIDTVVTVSDEDVVAIASAEGAEGTVVKCSFTAVALSPNLKSKYASPHLLSPIQPLRLLVPASYPTCSPVLLDKFTAEASKENEDLSAKVKSRFNIYLRSLSQPMSLSEIARTWDICARTIISEHTQQMGGGSFSSKYGTWENCLSAA